MNLHHLNTNFAIRSSNGSLLKPLSPSERKISTLFCGGSIIFFHIFLKKYHLKNKKRLLPNKVLVPFIK